MSALARHAVVLVHGMRGPAGQGAVQAFVGGGGSAVPAGSLRAAGLAEEGDRVVSRTSMLPGSYGAPVDSVTWSHDPEATVLAQQVDSPPLREGQAATDFYEVRCSGPFRDGRHLVRRGWPRNRAEAAELFCAERDAVLDLLEALHDARDPATGRASYERVIVVGHRWGGPIGRAAVLECWRGRRSGLEPDNSGMAAALGTVQRTAARLGAVEEPAADRPDDLGEPSGGPYPDAPRGAVEANGDGAALRSRYRQAQAGLWRLLRDEIPGPRRWLVSDLVTLGYPAAKADRIGMQALEDAAGGRASPGGPSPPLLPVRWTNIWFRHDLAAGPLDPALGPGAEDVALGGSALVAVMPRVRVGYWEESGLRLTREGSRLSIALLRRLVRRRPTLLLGTAEAPDPERLAVLAAALEQAAEYPTARGAVLADVRLLVGEDPRHAYAHPFPVGTVPIPAVIALREVRSLLGPGGRIQVQLSSDLLPDVLPD